MKKDLTVLVYLKYYTVLWARAKLRTHYGCNYSAFYDLFYVFMKQIDVLRFPLKIFTLRGLLLVLVLKNNILLVADFFSFSYLMENQQIKFNKLLNNEDDIRHKRT